MMFVSSSPINDITPQIEMAPASSHSATVQRSSDLFHGGAICPDQRRPVVLSCTSNLIALVGRGLRAPAARVGRNQTNQFRPWAIRRRMIETGHDRTGPA